MSKQKAEIRDYSLVGKETPLAIARGLAEAKWYQSPVPREKMRELLVRKNGPAIRDTLLWFGLIFGSGYLVYMWWGNWFVVFPYIVYSVLYASTSDSRWHESSHGTAFKTDWMNTALYEIASFMVLRQSTVWRWSHTRHHSDTIIRGRDPEIAVKRPPKVIQFIKTFMGLGGAIPEFRRLFIHASGKIDPEVATYLPKSEFKTVIFKARIYLLIFAGVIVLSIISKSILPLMFIGLPTILGTWLMPVYGLTQHAGLAENVLDHRLNCRTVYMNRVHRFLYWNMNYHVEHHMFPLVPYHALPKLHELIKDDCPPAYKSIADAFREIIPAVQKQMHDTSYYVERTLPEGAGRLENQQQTPSENKIQKIENGKVVVCSVDDLPKGEVVRFDIDQKTYAVYRTNFDNYYASDGICTHGNAHLAEGVVIDEVIECAKHNGRFNLKDGSPNRIPVCEGVKTYPVSLIENNVVMELPSHDDFVQAEKEWEYRVASNNNVATFIKELVLVPLEKNIDYQPGQYIRLSIPPHETSFKDFNIEANFRKVWKKMGLFNSWAKTDVFSKRNYSLSTNPTTDKELKFTIRIATSPDIKKISAGTGSSYVFGLQPGDKVKLTGPFGDFLIKDTGREMGYLGGGAGMAPIRSHISNLFDSLQTRRKVSFWYGARAKNDLFYTEYFKSIENNFPNFSYHTALSAPLATDNWKGETGFIHESLFNNYLKKHPSPTEIDYYLCGPPAMIKAARKMLNAFNIPDEQITLDEF